MYAQRIAFCATPASSAAFMRFAGVLSACFCAQAWLKCRRGWDKVVPTVRVCCIACCVAAGGFLQPRHVSKAYKFLPGAMRGRAGSSMLYFDRQNFLWWFFLSTIVVKASAVLQQRIDEIFINKGSIYTFWLKSNNTISRWEPITVVIASQSLANPRLLVD